MKTDSKWLRYIAIAGNAVFVLWVLFNAIDSGFTGTGPEKVSAIGLLIVLFLNSYLILKPKQ